MSDEERQLLQRLASEGKATTLSPDELPIANLLEANGLVLIVRNSTEAVITPKGRHKLANIEIVVRPSKKPLGFIE
jgi:hypothetical protein